MPLGSPAWMTHVVWPCPSVPAFDAVNAKELSVTNGTKRETTSAPGVLSAYNHHERKEMEADRYKRATSRQGKEWWWEGFWHASWQRAERNVLGGSAGWCGSVYTFERPALAVAFFAECMLSRWPKSTDGVGLLGNRSLRLGRLAFNARLCITPGTL